MYEILKKRSFFYFLLSSFLLIFVSCDKNKSSDPVHIDVASLQISPPELTLNIDESYSLEVVISPDDATNKKVIWNSADPDIVSVDQTGKVLALKEGNTLITATSEEDASISASVAISVEADAVIEQNYIRIHCAGEIGQDIRVRIIPKDAYDGTIWIDLNDNEIMDEGEEMDESKFGKDDLFYSIQSNSFNIYGDIKLFSSVGWKVFITSLDVSHSPYLETISCYYNRIEEIDLSRNLLLKNIEINQNSLSNLDLSNNDQLEYVSCGENSLKTLNLINNSKLELLFCGENQLTSLNVRENKLLHTLFCSDNLLESLDLSENTALTMLQCKNLRLKELDLTNNVLLREFYVLGNELTALDVTNAPNLVTLNCDHNKIEVLDVTENLKLEYLNCSYNAIKELDISNMEKLSLFEANNNLLEDVYVGNNKKLWYVRLQDNNIKSNAMSSIVENLLDRNGGDNGIIDINENPSFPTEAEQEALKNKNWTIY